MPAIEAVVETVLYAPDLDAIRPFYQDLLGLELLSEEPGHHLFFRVGDQAVLLFFNPESTADQTQLPPHGTHGAGHVAFGIAAAELDAWRARFQEAGVAIEQEVDWPGGARSFYVRDPAGNSIELLTPGLWGLPNGW